MADERQAERLRLVERGGELGGRKVRDLDEVRAVGALLANLGARGLGRLREQAEQGEPRHRQELGRVGLREGPAALPLREELRRPCHLAEAGDAVREQHREIALGVALERVRVEIVEAGHHVAARTLDALRRAGLGRAAGRRHLHDAPVVDDDRHARCQRAGSHVDDRDVREDEILRRPGRPLLLGAAERRDRSERDDAGEACGAAAHVLRSSHAASPSWSAFAVSGRSTPGSVSRGGRPLAASMYAR